MTSRMTTWFTEMESWNKEEAGKEFRLAKIEAEMQKCMTGISKLGLRVKLGIGVTYVQIRNQVYKDDN